MQEINKILFFAMRLIKAKNEDEILRKNKSKDIFEASNIQYEFKITGKQK